MYMLLPPAPLLQPYIECYWFVNGSDLLREALPVDGRADILFNFGTPYERQMAGKTTELSQSNVDAQRTYPLTIHQQGNIQLAGVRFQVLGLSAFISVPIYALSDEVHEPLLIFGKTINVLEARLFEAPTIEAKKQVLDVYFLQRLSPRIHFPVVRQAIQQIETQLNPPSITALSDQAGFSERNFRRLFREMLGFSPKYYLRVARFQRALQLLQSADSESLAQIALRGGYYDQAHFTREFLEFAGSSPEKYRATLPAKQP